jgi:HEAT repeat protein
MQRFMFLRSKWIMRIIGILLLVLGVGGWLCRDPLVGWYGIHRLKGAGEADRETWVRWVADRRCDMVPSLLVCLCDPSPRVCHNAQAALAALAARWRDVPPRQLALADRLSEVFPQLSLAGQCSVLELEAGWLHAVTDKPLPSAWEQAALRLLPPAGRSPDKDVRSRALYLASALLAHGNEGEVLTVCREVTRKSLQDADAENRALAAQLASRRELNLLTLVPPLLDDPEPAVRHAAMLTVGPYPDAIATDDLLRSLHDTDDDVRQLCEAALRNRGLKNEDVALGRLISDDRPGVRLQVLEKLLLASDLEPGIWLRRLSHDPSPAVRAAAIRAAGDHRQVDFSDRLIQMAQNDPSPTVRQLARYYLSVPRND